MHKTKQIETADRIMVDINGLQGMLSLGRGSADLIGEKAGAVIKVGRRKLYNVKKVEQYLETATEV